MTRPAPSANETLAVRSIQWRWVGGSLLALAVVMRINNALRYRTGSGFDAVENVAYIERLMLSWGLPAPDAAWATSHPPLFYYLSAAIGRLLGLFSAERAVLQLVPLLASAGGIGIAWLAYSLVRRAAPGDLRRAVVAGALILFLPVQIYTSAMVSEEMLAALLTSLVLIGGIALRDVDGELATRRALLQAGGLGVIAGLALLTKLSGCLVAGAVGLAWLLQGLRTGALGRASLRVGVMAAATLGIGGWFYLRNLLEFGYLYPQDLGLHAVMFEMPPGERGLLDYVWIPLATFTDPQLLNSDLLHSVWGGTYTTAYFDGHRHFLGSSDALSRVGGLMLALGLIPCTAFLVGLARGVRRSLQQSRGVDMPMLLLVTLSLAGYVAFTYGNPWFATLKSSYLLGLSVPFAFYASEVLASWTEPPGARSLLLWVMLGILVALVAVTFTIGPVFQKLDGPGLPWRAIAMTGGT